MRHVGVRVRRLLHSVRLLRVLGLQVSRTQFGELLLCKLRLDGLLLSLLLGLQLSFVRLLEGSLLLGETLLLLLVCQALLLEELLLASNLLLGLAGCSSHSRLSRGTLGGNTSLGMQLHVRRRSGLCGTFTLVPLVGQPGLFNRSLS